MSMYEVNDTDILMEPWGQAELPSINGKVHKVYMIATNEGPSKNLVLADMSRILIA